MALAKSLNGFDLSFIHEDHFACVSINIARLMSNSDLGELPLDTWEQELGKLVGKSNSSINSIERAWLLLDCSGLSFGDDIGQVSPLILVLDYKSKIDESELAEANRKTEEQSREKGLNLIASMIGDSRIVIGSPALTSKVASAKGDANLARQLKQMKLDGDIDGLFDIGPIRSTLRSMFGMVGSFGGEEVAKISRLPEVLQRVEISCSLDSNDMLRAVAYIDDDELTVELADLFNQTGQSGASSIMGSQMPFGFGGSRSGGGRATEMMLTPTSVEVMNEVGKEISEKNLFSVVGKDHQVTLKLGRPGKLKELIAASIFDAKGQIELATRVENLKKIATAMGSYVEKYQCFPPCGIVNRSAEGLPSQFNWRVGLLPFLDEQALYEQFDFSKPWNSPENQLVAKQMPSVFAVVSKGESGVPGLKTRWHVVGGDLGLYKGDRTPTIDEITDKKIWTALVIEGDQQTAVNWTKPGSLKVDSAELGQFGLSQENGILFLNAALEPRIIRKDQRNLHDILTPDGGETIQHADFLPLLPGTSR